MDELKKQYLAAQSRWKDLQFNKNTYLNLLREVTNERQKIQYIVSVSVLEATGILTSDVTTSYCYFQLGDRVFITKSTEHRSHPIWREYFYLTEF
jgi:hypothetical protein